MRLAAGRGGRLAPLLALLALFAPPGGMGPATLLEHFAPPGGVGPATLLKHFAPPGRGGLVALIVGSGLGRAETLEPPPEAPEDEDYEVEPADSLDADAVEVGFGAGGRANSAPQRRRRLRFKSQDLGGAAREGAGDPLAGGGLEARAAGGSLSLGRLAPRWGRGLALGPAAEPWSRVAPDRGERTPWRGRAGEGAIYRRGEADGLEFLCGRFGRRDLAGARATRGAVGLGALVGRAGHRQASLSLAPEAAEIELVIDRAGRWRSEGALERPLGAATLYAHARGGLPGFRPLAEPLRSGPAQALALALETDTPASRLSAAGALWRFRPGCNGARAALEVDRRLAHHGRAVLGFEEQHGVRRELSQRAGGFRQGLWGEWRGGTPALALALRHEAWGTRSFARRSARVVTTARVEARGPCGVALGVTHSVYRVRRGESLYLPEAESDRLVLRALSGAGERTRLEVRAPLAAGRVSAALNLAAAGTTPARMQWTLDWTRRARLARGP